MDGVASESVHPQSQPSAPSSRRFNGSGRLETPLERLRDYCGRASMNPRLDASDVYDQMGTLSGLPSFRSDTRVVVVPKLSVIAAQEGVLAPELRRISRDWPVYNKAMLHVLRTAGAVTRDLAEFRDDTAALVGPSFLKVSEERTAAFYDNAEKLSGDVVVVPLEMHLPKRSVPALLEGESPLADDMFWVDPYLFGVALMSNQLPGWFGCVDCIGAAYRQTGRTFDRAPFWRRYPQDKMHPLDRIIFDSQRKIFCGRLALLGVGLAPASVFRKD